MHSTKYSVLVRKGKVTPLFKEGKHVTVMIKLPKISPSMY